MKAGYRVVVLDSDFGDVTVEGDVLELQGHSVELLEPSWSGSADDLPPQADAVIVQWSKLDAEAIARLHGCKVIARYGIGVDSIDIDAAARAGIAVVNVPDYCIEEVATHATSMLLSLHRRLPHLDAGIRAGTWKHDDLMERVEPLSNSTLGLIGLGRTAQRVAALVSGLGVRIVAFDPFLANSPDAAIELLDYDEVLRQSDMVSVHVPLSASTRAMVDARALALLGSRAVIVNCSRGEIIDAEALADALDEGIIAGAALDVFDVEPLPANSRLRRCRNLILTPHVAWASAAAPTRLRRGVAENINRFLNGDPACPIVNGVKPPMPKPEG